MTGTTGSKAGKRVRMARRRMSKDVVKAVPHIQDRVVTVPVVDSDNPEEIERALAEHFPGWVELSKLEKADLAELIQAQRSVADHVKVKLVRKPEGGFRIELVGKSEVLAILKMQRAFGANSVDSVNARASELISYLDSVGACTDARYNAALAFVESMKPRDQGEALLLVQMYVTHDAAIRALSQIGRSEWIPTTQTFGNLAVRLLRVSQSQMDTLARMRRGGEQVGLHYLSVGRVAELQAFLQLPHRFGITKVIP